MEVKVAEPEMAIIKGVGIGMRDCREPVLWFDVHIASGGAALQVLNWTEAKKLIADYSLYDVRNLEGKPCLVVRDQDYLRYHSAWTTNGKST